MFIYKITNNINNKIYIGQTIQKNPRTRWYRHISNAKLGIAGYLYNAIRFYGKENFVFEIICCSKSIADCNFLEEFFITKFQTNDKNFGYNILAGGFNRKHTKESNEKNRIAHLNKPCKKSTRKKISNANKGKKPWNNGLTGLKKSEEAKRNLSKALKGLKKSKKHKKSLSQAKKEWYKTNSSPSCKKIICITTNVVYKSIQEAANYYKCKNAHIARVCRKERKHFKGLVFEFLSNPSNVPNVAPQ